MDSAFGPHTQIGPKGLRLVSRCGKHNRRRTGKIPRDMSLPAWKSAVMGDVCTVCQLWVSWCCEVQSVSWAEALGRKTGQRWDCPGPAPGFGLAEAGFLLNTLHTTPGEMQHWKGWEVTTNFGVSWRRFTSNPKGFIILTEFLKSLPRKLHPHPHEWMNETQTSRNLSDPDTHSNRVKTAKAAEVFRMRGKTSSRCSWKSSCLRSALGYKMTQRTKN